MVPNFGMRVIHAPVDSAIHNQTDSNTGANRDVDQPRFVSPCAPPCLAKSRGICVVFDRHRHAKGLLEILYRILAIPVREKVDVPNGAGQGINRSRGTNADSRDFLVCLLFGRSKHLNYRIDRFSITCLRVSTRPSASTSPEAIFVPPISTAPIMTGSGSGSSKCSHCFHSSTTASYAPRWTLAFVPSDASGLLPSGPIIV